MNGFNWEKLGEVIEVKDGTHDSPKYTTDKSGYPLVTSKNIKEGKVFLDDCNYISESDYKKINQRSKVNIHDIIMPMIGTIGNPCLIIEEPNYAIKNVALFKTNGVNPKYLFYWLKSDFIKNKFRNDSKGGIQKFVSLKYLRNLPFPNTTLEKQEQISNILEKAEKLIKLRKDSIKKLEELSKSIFIDMFGDPIQNPKNWSIKNLKELSTHILSGNTPKGGSQVYVDEGILFFRSQNVWKNNIILDDIAYIDDETHSKMKKSSLKYKDILMTKTGRINTENSSLGRASLFLGEDDSANINGHVYLIRLKDSMIHEFIVYILTTNEYRDYIRSVCVGGIDKRQINKVHLEEFPIIFPKVELQKQFAKIIEKIEQQKTLYEKQLKKLQYNFDALLAKSFEG